MNVKHHNVLPPEDLVVILDSYSGKRSQAMGYLNRLVIVVGIMLGVRPTEMAEWTVDQFIE